MVVSLVSGFAAEACLISLRIGQVFQALLQFELGRGLVLGNIISSRITLEALEELSTERLDLADRFETLRNKAFKEVSEYHPFIRQHKLQQRRKAESDYRNCVEEIRRETSFRDFVADPTIRELQNQAAEGVIMIVNVTDISSDAIIVPPAPGKIRHIALPELEVALATIPQLVRKQVEQYRRSQGRGVVDPKGKKVSIEVEFLLWLWSNCVQVIHMEIGCSPVSDPAEHVFAPTCTMQVIAPAH